MMMSANKQKEDLKHLKDNLQFRCIITFLKNSKMKTSAAWLAMKVLGLSIPEAIHYRDGCHVCSTDEGALFEPDVKMKDALKGLVDYLSPVCDIEPGSMDPVPGYYEYKFAKEALKEYENKIEDKNDPSKDKEVYYLISCVERNGSPCTFATNCTPAQWLIKADKTDAPSQWHIVWSQKISEVDYNSMIDSRK